MRARLGIALLVACYNPQVPEQVPCPDNICPTGQVCSLLTHVCVLPGQGSNPLVDAAIDGPMPVDAFVPRDAPAGSACYGKGFITACFASPPTGTITISTAIDTDTDARCQATSSATCQITASTITVQNTVRVTGNRPLVLVASSTVSIDGTLDASSHVGDANGAAANSSSCLTGTLPFPQSLAGAAGGSFTTSGGNGGKGADGAPVGIPGGTLVPASVMGGCAGQNNGSGTTGGAGGGAVYVIAGNMIAVNGTIDASGAGGGPSGINMQQGIVGGGTGGGAGGMIGLDATSVVLEGNALLLADGGGGGGGGGGESLMPTSGAPGMDPTSTSPALGGAGGSAVIDGIGSGGAGGDGAASGTNGQSGHNGGVDGGAGGGGAGGGGGGGEGVIEVWGTFQGLGLASPPVTTH